MEWMPRRYAEGHPWARYPHRITDQAQWYDWPHYAYLAWRANGDESYRRAAIENFVRDLPSAPENRNQTREDTVTWALLACELWPHLSLAEREVVTAKFATWAEHILAYTRADDSDEVVGHYCGLALIDQVLGTGYSIGDGTINPAEMLRCIGTFIERSRGGVWIEGTSYNMGTVSLLLVGALALGVDHFPGLREWLPQLSRYLRFSFTPDFRDTEQHGDIENPHDPGWPVRVPLMAQCAGLMGESQERRDLLSLLAILTEGVDPYLYHQNLYRALWTLDPGEISEPRDTAFGLFVGEGVGLVLWRTETDLLQVLMYNPLHVDHAPSACWDVRWWHRGAWLLDHPIGYQAPWQSYNCGVAGSYALFDNRGLISASEANGAVTVRGFAACPHNIPGTWTTLFFLERAEREVRFDGSLRIKDSWWMNEPRGWQTHLYPPTQGAWRGDAMESNELTGTIEVVLDPPAAERPTMHDGHAWTFGSEGTGGRQTLRDGAHAGGGYGVEYRVAGGGLYARNDTGDWFTWDSIRWWSSEPPLPPPPPTPTVAGVLARHFAALAAELGAM